MGASTNRQIFEDIPRAVIEAAAAIENPFCVSINGSDTAMNPWLIPDGRTKNKKINAFAVFRLHAILRYTLVCPG